ncbi:MAG TPA: hypothetical protein EYP21_09290 [Syntrophaceae bacterium]|nr:hypothetical protein [Syntrophaceae bacterium]
MRIRNLILVLLVWTSVFYLGCAWNPVYKLFTLFGKGPEEKGEIGKPATVDLFYNQGEFGRKDKAETKANVTVTEVTVSPEGESCYLVVDVKYENIGKKRMEWAYGNAYLLDSKGRMYEGKDYFDFVDFLEKPDRPFNFIEAEAGMSAHNFVVFKLPRSAFEDKIFFGFVSMLDPDNVQGKILIFDRSKSTYSFSKEKSFKSVSWSD